MATIDIHTHFMPRPYLELLGTDGPRNGVEVVTSEQGEPIIMFEGHPFGPIGDVFFDADKRLADMDARRVDVHCLSLSPPMVYWADKELGIKLASVFNEETAKVADARPDRFIAIATLPMQDVPAALAEGEKAIKELGMKGFYLGTNVLGKYLSDKDFWPIYELAQSLEIPIFVHPLRVVGADRMDSHYLHNSIGNPTETTLAIAKMIFNGVPQDFPRLKFNFAHAGGAFPYLIGRLDRTFEMRKECQEAIPQPPSTYLDNFSFDTITHRKETLAFLISLMGADKVLLGSDYPFDMGDDDPVASVEGVEGLPPEQTENILSANAVDLLGLGAGHKSSAAAG
ncbi:MAG: amidohydrolase family protein [bacterium]